MKRQGTGPFRQVSGLLATVFVLALLAAGAHAQSTAEDRPESGRLPLRLEKLVDPPADMRIEDVCCGNANFRPLEEPVLKTTFGSKAQWFRIDSFGRDGVLVLDALVDEADLYVVDRSENVIEHMQAGDTRAASVRALITPRIAFPVSDLDLGDRIFLRVLQQTVLTAVIAMLEPDAFRERATNTAIFRAALLGGISVMVLYNIVLSAIARDLTFLFNALTIFSILVVDLYLSGVGSAYIWAEAPWISNRALNLALLSASVFGSLFFFFFLKDDGQVGRRTRNALLAIPTLAALFLPIVPLLAYWQAQIVVLGLVVGILVVNTVVCAVGAARGSKRSIALLAPLVGAMIPGAFLTVGRTIFGMDFGRASEHILEITLVFEALLFSMMLAYRIRLAEGDRSAIREALIDHMTQSERRLLAAVDQERSRIASDLHDTAGQGLVAVANRLARLGRAPDLPASINAEIGEAAAISREMVGDIRRISHDLHSATLQQLGLSKALEALAERAKADGRLAVEIENDVPDSALSAEQAQHVYRIVQELVVNAIKHSGAELCKVVLHAERGLVELEVRDDGRGIPADAGSSRSGGLPGGMGLELVAQRVRCLGGNWSVRAVPKGTSFALNFPSGAVAVGG